MYNFPEGLYCDVRIEDIYSTAIAYKKEELQSIKVRNNKGAFIRVFDGEKWYFTSTTEMDGIQDAILELAQMAKPNKEIYENPIVKKFEVHEDELIQYEGKSLTKVDTVEKQELIFDLMKEVDEPSVTHYQGIYVDKKVIKQIYTSKGSNITFDKQTCGVKVSYDLKDGENTDSGSYSKSGIFFDDLKELEKDLKEEIDKSVYFVQNAEVVEAGDYTVLFAPEAAGVFTHESFGHKSESDFMLGDETMKKEWAIGKTIARSLLNIVEDGTVFGNGYTPYDDEGNRGRKNYIIKDGNLTGRLHSTETAAIFEEELTGNARAMNFEYEPLVRMTTTYIDKGDRPLADIISEIEKGVFVETIKHGSGMSTFTIAPARAYMIENGKITKPVKVSVVTGSVFEALEEVDALSEEFELLSFVGGGCGKMEQYPLPVGFGGPYTRVRKLTVQ